MQKAETLILSDIHLGSEDCNAGQVLEVLGSWLFGRLIVNGDLHEQRKPITKEQFEIVNFLSRNREKVILISGNHDPIEKGICLLTGIKQVKDYRWHAGGKKFYATHGHRFDGWHWIFQDEYVDWLFSRFVNLLKGVKFSGIDLERSVNGFHDGFSMQIALRAGFSGIRNGDDVVFCGHTHFPMHHRFIGKNGKIVDYYNSGACLGNSCTFIATDTFGNVQLHGKSKKSGP